jgi:uncharacterized membrane protein YfcA
LSAALLVALATVLVAGVVAGVTGFGLSLISTPALLMVFDPPTVVTVNMILALSTGLVIVAEDWREVRFGAVLYLLPWSFVGLALGAALLTTLDPDYIRLAAGIVVLLSAILLVYGVALIESGGRWRTVAVGVLSGTLATSTGFPSPLVTLLFAARRFAKRSLRASGAAYFSAVGAIGLATLIASGTAQGTHFALAGIFIPAALSGKVLGSVLLRRLSNEMFRGVTLAVAMLAGTLGISTAILALI